MMSDRRSARLVASRGEGAVLLSVFGAALLVYWLSSLVMGRAVTPQHAHFPQLAEAFLHGRLYIDAPRSLADLTSYGGRWYVAFPPLPALLMLPGVALFGVDAVNTTLVANVMSALTVAFVYGMLSTLSANGWSHLGRRDNLWLTVLFGVGTVAWYIGTLGSVWFVSQACTTTFIALSVWLACAGRSPALIGSALALAVLGRPHTALTYPLLLGIVARHHDAPFPRAPWSAWARWSAGALPPLLLTIGLLGAYNLARFGDITDFGYLGQNVAVRLRRDLATYGQFDLAYVWRNLHVMLFGIPKRLPDGAIIPNGHGMSMLITTPALVYVVLAGFRRWLAAGAWIAVGLVLVPLVTYYNTGWMQFGYRFSLDFSIPLMILLALGARGRVSWPMRVLILVGVLVNAWGVAWFPNPG